MGRLTQWAVIEADIAVRRMSHDQKVHLTFCSASGSVIYSHDCGIRQSRSLRSYTPIRGFACS